MKSSANSIPVFVVPPNVESNDGPAPTISSVVFERSNGFLKRISVLQSVVPDAKSGPVPISISSQSLIGVNSTATVGPTLDKLGAVQFVAAPISRTARGSYSSACATVVKSEAVERTATKVRFIWLPLCRCTFLITSGDDAVWRLVRSAQARHNFKLPHYLK